jgi:hypothetical protein
MILTSKRHLTSEQYRELKPFKKEESRYDALFGKESLELQHFMAALDISREELMRDYSINECQLKDFLFGTLDKSDEEKFHIIYADLKLKMDEKIRESRKRAQEKLLNSGKRLNAKSLKFGDDNEV